MSAKSNFEKMIDVQAKQYGEMMEHTVSRVRKNKVNDTRATMAFLDEKRAKILVDKYVELHKLMEQLEGEALMETKEITLKPYTFVGAVAEYSCDTSYSDDDSDLSEDEEPASAGFVITF